MNDARAIVYLGLCMVSVYSSQARAQPEQRSIMLDMPSLRVPEDSLSSKQRRKADDLYLAGVRAFTKSNFALASFKFHEAASLDRANQAYAAAAATADGYAHRRGLTVAAATDLLSNDSSGGAQATPQSVVKDAVSQLPPTPMSAPMGPITLHPKDQLTSVHMQAPSQEVMRKCFASYGIGLVFDSSAADERIRLDMDNASFAELSKALEMLTRTFVVAMEADRAIVFKDTAANRQRFEPLSYETVEASSLQQDQVITIQNIARDLLGIKNVIVQAEQRRITLRGPRDRLLAFNDAFREIFVDRAEILIDVQMYQLARSRTRNIGLQLPQQANVFNINAEASKLISDSQSVVDQAISSGLVESGDTLGIVALLIAGGYASNSPLGEGFAVFGGGISWSGLSFGTTMLHLALNSSESHLVGKIQLRMKDGEKATLRNGSRYPIATSQYSSITTSSSLTTSQLAALGLSSSSTSSSSTIPQVQYEELGLTLAATPTVHADDNIELHLDLKLRNLSGSSLNDIPILTNRQFAGDITVQSDETAMLSSSLTTQESKALSGVPGLSDLPGFQTATTGGDRQKDTDEVVVLVTPHVIRPSRSASASAVVLLPFHLGGDEP